MLPKITPENTILPLYRDYLTALHITVFSGEIRTDYASRLAAATDNSVYQVIPQAVVFPVSTDDVAVLLSLAQKENFRGIRFSPRGGGTATNGQSLSAGIIIDCSKYLTDILEINAKDKWVRVQPGVILDQLNQALRKQGVFFAPEISPSNRATLGGMINTDACGNGSKTLGRTSDHVLDLTCVLSNGKIINTTTFNDKTTDALLELLKKNEPLIQEKFFNAPRTLNGYNLKKALQHDKLNLNYLFCGSEGTLAIVTECRLKLSTLPKFKKLVVIKYASFENALQANEITESIRPLVIETIDEKLIALARQDSIYFQIKDFIDGANAVNLVEFVADDLAELDRQIEALCQNIKNSSTASGFYVAQTEKEIKLLWDLRKKSVGLISKRQDGTRRPIPFVEDTAVPPEKLAAYIAEFKALLDRHQLIYGMYGHVDAGCVHVRPALDMKLETDEKLFREISNAVVKLVKKYGGVIWGEHGKGFRSEYGPEFFGSELYHVLREIKTLFDPYNQFNPGKIAVPLETQDNLVHLTDSLRGHQDKTITAASQQEFPTAMSCNGNGACFNFISTDPMCPSYKLGYDRVHSPKGRATLIREWLRQLSLKNYDWKSSKFGFLKKMLLRSDREMDFSTEVYDAMNGCLGCKACANQCPLSVDVPDLKSKFLSHYHKRYFRPLRDYLIARTEKIAKWQGKFPRTLNWLLRRKFTHWFTRRFFRVKDLPQADTLNLKIKTLNLTELNALSSEQKKLSVILLQDAFTSFYDKKVFAACRDFFTSLGLKVHVAAFFPNGKPLHVKGFLTEFDAQARKNIAYLRQLAATGIPLIGLDPSITLTYRDEYKKLLGNEAPGFEILLPQEFLHAHLDLLPTREAANYFLLSHCTEKTALPETEKLWTAIFAKMGIVLTPLAAGCCGMAGSYGHEIEHQFHSEVLFSVDWNRHLCENPQADKTILATGFSCRSQIKRLRKMRIQHPLEILR